ncbi:MAG TPA: SxtJ family membrane protein [Puia sp.]|nr:SxtJ family membrane protein [Puia sp.]
MHLSKEQTKDFGMVTVLVTAFLAFRFKEYNYIRIAFVLSLVTIVLPMLFYPFAFCWFGLSRILGTIGSRILLGIIFLILVIPIGLVRKITGYDHLQLKQFKKSRKSVLMDRDHVFDDADLLNTF